MVNEMLSLLNCFFKKATPMGNKDISVPTSHSLSSSNNATETSPHKSFMLVRAYARSLDIESFKNGTQDKYLQELYQNSRSIFFFDPVRKTLNPAYKVFPDLISLKKSRANDADIGINENNAFILCFDEPVESVYAKIESGKFHEAISEVITYCNYLIHFPKPKTHKPK
jgi:hypothetical protein